MNKTQIKYDLDLFLEKNNCSVTLKTMMDLFCEHKIFEVENSPFNADDFKIENFGSTTYTVSLLESAKNKKLPSSFRYTTKLFTIDFTLSNKRLRIGNDWEYNERYEDDYKTYSTYMRKTTNNLVDLVETNTDFKNKLVDYILKVHDDLERYITLENVVNIFKAAVNDVELDEKCMEILMKGGITLEDSFYVDGFDDYKNVDEIRVVRNTTGTYDVQTYKNNEHVMGSSRYSEYNTKTIISRFAEEYLKQSTF